MTFMQNINFGQASSGGTSGANKLPSADVTYLLRFDGAVVEPSTNPQTVNQPIFKATFTVLESTHPEVAVNSVRSWTQNLMQSFGDRQYGVENTKQLLAALYGLQPGTPEADALDNPEFEFALQGNLNGEMVRCTTVPKVSKAGRAWTLHIFAPTVEDEDDAYEGHGEG